MRAVSILLACVAVVNANGGGLGAYKSSASTCDASTSEKTCMTAVDSATGDKCSWCNSAAVGGTCFTSTDAKSLPSSVFQCKYQVYGESAATCDSVTSEKTCMTSSSATEKCSWCNSAAVGGTCFVESDAKSLPSSVFQCEYQKSALKTSTCDAVTSEKTCMTTTGSDGKCSWCNSAAVGGTCFTEVDAKSLPSSVFKCEYQTPGSWYKFGF